MGETIAAIANSAASICFAPFMKLRRRKAADRKGAQPRQRWSPKPRVDQYGSGNQGAGGARFSGSWCPQSVSGVVLKDRLRILCIGIAYIVRPGDVTVHTLPALGKIKAGARIACQVEKDFMFLDSNLGASGAKGAAPGAIGR